MLLTVILFAMPIVYLLGMISGRKQVWDSVWNSSEQIKFAQRTKAVEAEAKNLETKRQIAALELECEELRKTQNEWDSFDDKPEVR